MLNGNVVRGTVEPATSVIYKRRCVRDIVKNEIVLYRPNELAEHIEVRFDEDTAWLTQQQMTVLFNQTKPNRISAYI